MVGYKYFSLGIHWIKNLLSINNLIKKNARGAAYAGNGSRQVLKFDRKYERDESCDLRGTLLIHAKPLTTD